MACLPERDRPLLAAALARWIRFWQWGQRDGTDADAFMGTSAARRVDPVIRTRRPAVPARRRRNPSLGQIAVQRGTSVQHLAEVTAAAYTPADLTELATVQLAAGIPYYTTNP